MHDRLSTHIMMHTKGIEKVEHFPRFTVKVRTKQVWYKRPPKMFHIKDRNETGGHWAKSGTVLWIPWSDIILVWLTWHDVALNGHWADAAITTIQQNKTVRWERKHLVSHTWFVRFYLFYETIDCSASHYNNMIYFQPLLILTSFRL